jgi:trimethylamine---corrinoid protein Co-methyltransferase
MSDAASMTPRRARGGRARRQREAQRVHAVIAGIERKIPTYELLDEEGLARIEAVADAILQEVGMDFRGDDDAQGCGAKPVPSLKANASASPLDCCDQFSRRRLAPSSSMRAIPSARSGSAAIPSSSRPPTGLRSCRISRAAAPWDARRFESFVKLAYAIPWLHHSGGTVWEPVDIPVNKRHLDMVGAHLRFSDKPFMGSVTTEERAEDSIAMARIAFGRDFVDANCVIMGNIKANSPLVFDGTMSRALRAYARANQCAVVVPFILGGAMGPVTSAGAVAQALAETMVGCALTQLERPGAPVIFGNFLSSTALRSGSRTFGTPEPALGSLVIGQLARRLKLPLRCSGAFTSSKIPDGQAMQESTMPMLAAVQCGANFILHSAGWLEGGLTMGYEKFVMDTDFCAAPHVWMRGLPLDDNALALDAFREVGRGKHFFGAAHTLANYGTAFRESAVADNNSLEQWRDEGMKDAPQRASERCKCLLAEYEQPRLDPAVDKELNAFVSRRKGERPDQWH